MKIPDVNVLVAAFRPDHAQHRVCAQWLVDTMNGGEPLGLLHLVVTGFIRVTTHPRIFRSATSPVQALQQIDFLLRHPGVEWVRPGAQYWDRFTALCRPFASLADLTHDLHIAAAAIERQATVVTMDRDFSRFPNVSVQAP